MDTYWFEAIGTRWSISTDKEVLTNEVKTSISDWLKDFEKRFSRFIETSEVNAFRHSVAGTYEISNEFLTLLERAEYLKKVTGGAFDPAVAQILEQAGYDAEYSLTPKEGGADSNLAEWHLDNDRLVINGGISFDLGGIGKGYAIDMVSEIIKRNGVCHYIIDAGGDIFATTKSDGRPWRIAIEYPGHPEKAAGIVELNNQAVAVSDIFKRKWRNWHHIVDAKSKLPTDTIIGASAVANTAFDADSMTSVLFLADVNVYKKVAEDLVSSYLLFNSDGTCGKSSDWAGELFCKVI
ncbi:FAD:protein FMN transferase [Candidatus Kaiserbacteria bacterium]|nr:FAD:protein FMN transferase [Candidatus Kaiserbacteria bacterium]